MRTALTLTGLLLLLVMPATLAQADTFELNVSNGDISPSVATYGTITLTLDTTNHTIHVALDMTQPGYHFGQEFGFNVTGSIDGLLISNPQASGGINDFPTTWTLFTDSGLDDFGTFTGVVRAGNPDYDYHTFSFDVGRNDGFSSLSELEVANSGGWLFAAYVFPVGVDDHRTAYDGAAAVGAAVPEPSIVLLLALGVGAASLMGYRFRG